MCLKNLDDGDALVEMQTLEVGLRLIECAPFCMCLVGDAHRFKSWASSQKLAHLGSLLTKWPCALFYIWPSLYFLTLPTVHHEHSALTGRKDPTLGYLLVGCSVELKMTRLVRPRWRSSFGGT